VTQAELGERSGRSTDMISRLERASISPSLETIDVLATVLDVQPAELLGGKPSHPTPRSKRLQRLIAVLIDADEEKLAQIERVIKAL
jgi:transcriptional regulator with XRE-family HTH domain